jgi:uncharacterized protein
MRVCGAVTLRVLTNADRLVFETFLSRHAASTMFLRSNALKSGLMPGEGPYFGLYAGRFEDDALTDVAAQYWNGNIILFAPTAAAELAAFVAATSQRAVKGFLGPWAQCTAAMDGLGMRHQARAPRAEDLFELDLGALVFAQRHDVSYRRAPPSDIDLIGRWRMDYEIETLGAEAGPDLAARARADMEAMIARGDVWVACADGVGVSMSGINARLPDMVQVGGVHTPKHLRGRGYSKVAVAGSLMDCKSDGARTAILFTEVRNAAAQRVYTALGFQRIGDYGLILF